MFPTRTLHVPQTKLLFTSVHVFSFVHPLPEAIFFYKVVNFSFSFLLLDPIPPTYLAIYCLDLRLIVISYNDTLDQRTSCVEEQKKKHGTTFHGQSFRFLPLRLFISSSAKGCGKLLFPYWRETAFDKQIVPHSGKWWECVIIV